MGHRGAIAARVVSVGALVAGAFAITATFRFLALNGFPNDHFIHLAGAQQILFGEWPTRDFQDPGLPLMYGASALAQALLGHTLFAEAVLVSVAFGLAASLTAIAVLELTSSVLLATVAVLFEVAIFPRTYGYPKILLYAAGFLLFSRYVSLPSTRRLAAMALCAAIAFLFRHDHGLYLGLGGFLTAVLAPGAATWPIAARRGALFVILVAALLAPYFIYIQAHGGVWLYMRTGIEFSAREAGRQGRVWPSLFSGAGSTQEAEPAAVVLVYLFHLLPLAAIAVVAAHRARPDRRILAARIIPLAVVAVLVNLSFIRDPLTTRLPDAIVPAAMLGTWLVGRAWSAPRPGAIRIALWIPLSLALLIVAGASVVVFGNTREEIDRMGLAGQWRRLPQRLAEQSADLHDRFAPRQLPTHATGMLIPFFAYLDRCTAPDDRLLVAGFLPEVPYYARRPFAGGQSTFVAGYYGSEANQRQVLERLQRQTVPFVMIPSDEVEGFNRDFPIVSQYLHARYRHMTAVPVDEETSIDIQLDRNLAATATDPATGWPCAHVQSVRLPVGRPQGEQPDQRLGNQIAMQP